MSSNDYIFQANAKVGQHLINIVGVSQEEFQTNLRWATENAAGIVSALAALEGAYQVKALTPNVVPPVQVTNEAPGQWADRSHAQPQQGPAPSCAHGPMKHVPGGISKNTGKAYNAFYSCTAGSGSSCKTVNA